MTPVKGRFKVNGKAVKAVKGSWWQKCEVDVPDEAFVMDFVFSDGGHQYDNNNRADYHVACEGAEGSSRLSATKSASCTTSSSRSASSEKRAKERKERRDILRGIAKDKAAEVTRKQREHVLYVDPRAPARARRCASTTTQEHQPGRVQRGVHNRRLEQVDAPREHRPHQDGWPGGSVARLRRVYRPRRRVQDGLCLCVQAGGKGTFDNNNRLDYHVDIKGSVDKPRARS